MQAIEVRDFEIESRLEAYARARLSPDPQSTARARARVMREARLQFEAARIATHMAPVVVAAAARASSWRRVAMPLLAAAIWLGIAVGSISAAQPGGPLYQTRMWIENAALPAGGVERANAELSRLDARLGEAVSAAARGDANGVQAALEAYRQIADDTNAAATGDDALEARIAAALDHHRIVLAAVADGLGTKGNDTAAAAVEASIERAITHNEAVVERIQAGAAGKGPADGAGGSGGNAGSGGGGTGGGGTGGTGKTDGGSSNGNGAPSSHAPRPTATPTPTPDGNGRPERTPRPTPVATQSDPTQPNSSQPDQPKQDQQQSQQQDPGGNDPHGGGN